MKYDVFISYSRKDSAMVKKFADELSKAGYSVWMDKDGIESGDELKRNIVAAIKESEMFLFFSSAASNASVWTVKEVNVAVMLHKPIIPIKLDSAIYDDSLMLDLAGLDFIICARNEDFTHPFGKLLRSLEKKIKKVALSLQDETSPSLQALEKGVSAYEKGEFADAVRWFRQSAEQGDDNAQYNLALCYEEGNGVSQSWEDAVYWYRESAEQGNSLAQHNLSVCYSNGTGVSQSWEDAVYWCRKSAEMGNAYAQYNLASCYAEGCGVPQSMEEAVKWYLKSAEQGYSSSQYNLASCYAEGNGVPQSWNDAIYWFRKSAESGEAAAMCKLGVCYDKGEGVSQSWNEAVGWYSKSAELGYSIAQYNLALCYAEGKGVPQSWDNAIYWWRQSAEQGDADAQYEVGWCYENGKGVVKSCSHAIEWYLLAASQGHEIAQHNLAEYYQKQAGRGDADAQCRLGMCYENGEGVPKNMAEAIKWYRLSAEQGYNPAIERLTELGEM